MNDLLTTRQVQELLKVNRITVYRMLQDGRLSGSKIGQQWRFSAKDVERLLKGSQVGNAELDTAEQDAYFPTHCLQTIQDVVSDLGHISVKIADLQGKSVTEMSNPCQFCALVLSSPTGAEACKQSWLETISDPGKWGKNVCHAGLHYTPRFILDGDRRAALVMAGHCRFQPYDPQRDSEAIKELAHKHGLSENDLIKAVQHVQVLDDGQRIYVNSWLGKVATAFESILQERARFMDRLQQITQLSNINGQG
jgi:excisionase family DNA binding protein